MSLTATPVPATKRRRVDTNTKNLNSTLSHVEIPATPKREEDPSTTVSTVGSGATSPAQESTTPLTSLSDYESELSDLDDKAFEEYQVDSEVDAVPYKGKGKNKDKATAPAPAPKRRLKRRKAPVKYDEDEIDDAEEEDKYVPEPSKPKSRASRRASGMAKQKIQTIVIEVSEEEEDVVGDDLDDEYDEYQEDEDDLDSVDAASAASDAPVEGGGFIVDDDDGQDQPVLPQNSYNRRRRARLPPVLNRVSVFLRICWYFC